VQGDAQTATELLAKRWDYIFFTGSVAVGKIVAKAAVVHLTPVTLELGGKNPCIVDQTAQLALAAKRIVWGKFMNAGRTCIAPDYILVQNKVKVDSLRAAQGRNRSGLRIRC
jgi:aldehyde dehydrogenase (NAD+)